MRELPKDLEAEQAFLASLLRRPVIIAQVQDSVQAVDFYQDAHAWIYEAICDLGAEADPVTVAHRLQETVRTGKFCSVEYLSNLEDSLSTSVGWQRYAGIVREMSQRRQIIAACETAADGACTKGEPVPDVLSCLKTGITAVEREQAPEIESALSIVQQVYREVEQRRESGNRFVGIRTGLNNIDSRLSGMEAGSTTYLIARPSIGKSALALTIADYVASHEGAVLFFSLESNRHALTRRRLAARSGLHLTWIRTGDIRDDAQWDALHDACEYLSGQPLMIVDHARYKDPAAIVSLSETVALTKPLKLIIVDYIQLTRPRRPLVSRHQEISQVSSDLQGLAKSCNCPLLILCQLSREIERRASVKGANKYPQLSDMKESGDLEQAADNVWSLWRENKDAKAARLEQLKGRDSGTWTTWLEFNGACQRFTDGDEPKEDTQMSWQDRV